MKARGAQAPGCLAAVAVPAAFRRAFVSALTSQNGTVSLHHKRYVRQQIIITVFRASRLFMYSIKLMFML
jgi:hypothetical protein